MITRVRQHLRSRGVHRYDRLEMMKHPAYNAAYPLPESQRPFSQNCLRVHFIGAREIFWRNLKVQTNITFHLRDFTRPAPCKSESSATEQSVVGKFESEENEASCQPREPTRCSWLGIFFRVHLTRSIIAHKSDRSGALSVTHGLRGTRFQVLSRCGCTQETATIAGVHQM